MDFRLHLQHVNENHLLDTFNEDCIRRSVISFYERGEIPSLSSILEKVKEPPVNFSGSQTMLHRLLKKIGFSFKESKCGKLLLMEKDYIVAARCKYLRVIREARNSSNPPYEVYLDETWVNQNESVKKCWITSDGIVGPKLKSGKGAHFIIVHAGVGNGFVPGGLLMFKSKHGNKGDYHDSMNHNCFKNWFTCNLLPNIPPGSLIIMDNAPYHSKVLNKAPNQSAKKQDIIRWLEENHITHNPTQTKSQLLRLAKTHKNKEIYEIDDIVFNHGHKVLRLSPYHCQLNPIERLVTSETMCKEK